MPRKLRPKMVKLNFSSDYSRGLLVFLSWNNYKEVIRELMGRPKRLPGDSAIPPCKL
jgi:hypothetical protein